MRSTKMSAWLTTQGYWQQAGRFILKIDPGVHSIDTPKNIKLVCCSSSKSRNVCSVVSFSPLLSPCYIRHSNRKLCTLTCDSWMKAEQLWQHHTSVWKHSKKHSSFELQQKKVRWGKCLSVQTLYTETEFAGKANVVRVATAGASGLDVSVLMSPC